MDGYAPTMLLRLKRGTNWISDERAETTFSLQQLWVSSRPDEEPEWRDIRIVDDDEKPIDHIAIARLVGRTR